MTTPIAELGLKSKNLAILNIARFFAWCPCARSKFCGKFAPRSLDFSFTMPRVLSPEEVTAWLRLSYCGLPTARTGALLEHFGSPDAIFEAAASNGDALREEFGLTSNALQKLRATAKKDVSKSLEAMQNHAINVIPRDEFPALLLETGDDCPPFLFARGEFAPEDFQSIAIVGTRKMTEYGRGMAHRLAFELARAGWTIVSGLATGIDTAAHRGALDAGGRTIAATGCGLDIVYPAENRDLMIEIENSGCVLSEWAPTTQPVPWHFPARNRIIAGLSVAVIVVEAQQKSGALITATKAGEWGRTVFAVPGNVHKPQSKGPHSLIREGAFLVESADDILDFLALETIARFGNEIGDFDSLSDNAEPVLKSLRPAKAPRPDTSKPVLPPQKATSDGAQPQGLSPNESRVWLCLEWEPRHFDDIAESAGLETGATNAALVMLEIKGFAQRQAGNVFVRTDKN